MRMRRVGPMVGAGLAMACASGCDSSTPVEAFELRFAATDDGTVIGCTSSVTGLGPGGDVSIGPSDLRFYVSNVRFFDAAGVELPVELDENAFQLSTTAGEVALIDLTGNSEGSCNGSSISFAEGTARTNDVIRGRAPVGDVARVSFDVGVPQALMAETISSYSAEGAPSPLDEMYWSWATGYRHLVFNFTVTAGAETGEGYVHVGSTDCAAEGMLALADRERCGFVNTATVTLDAFDLRTNSVGLDVRELLAGIDMISPVYDPMTFEVIGQGPGVECHSSPMQEDCPTIFGNVGLDMTTGDAVGASAAFYRR
ncbi:MAG: metallo-mystery pair system four-Cys motif protein [Deltaproteobacteria bacterium]|nr:metallo-mystery pair system four-Cys motif protein [Deltaproteobacteria bacterium]